MCMCVMYSVCNVFGVCKWRCVCVCATMLMGRPVLRVLLYHLAPLTLSLTELHHFGISWTASKHRGLPGSTLRCWGLQANAW